MKKKNRRKGWNGKKGFGGVDPITIPVFFSCVFFPLNSKQGKKKKNDSESVVRRDVRSEVKTRERMTTTRKFTCFDLLSMASINLDVLTETVRSFLSLSFSHFSEDLSFY
jgi:hypothetical protein